MLHPHWTSRFAIDGCPLHISLQMHRWLARHAENASTDPFDIVVALSGYGVRQQHYSLVAQRSTQGTSCRCRCVATFQILGMLGATSLLHIYSEFSREARRILALN